MPASNASDTAAAIEAIERIGGIEDGDAAAEGGAPYLVLPQGKRVESLKKIIDEFRTAPVRRTGTATLTTIESFVEHTKRFASGASVIFAEPQRLDMMVGPSLTTVFDYHPAGPDVTNTANGTHRASYPFPVAEEWAAWMGKNNAGLGTEAFAQHIEDRVLDLVTVDDETSEIANLARLVGGRFASPSQLIDLSRSISISAAVNVAEARTLATGEINVIYSEIHSSKDGEGKPVKVPNMFAIGIPVFRSGVRYRIACRLRYKLASGRVTWSYSMINPSVYTDTAVREACAQVAKDTGLPVYQGSPEK